MPLDYVEPGYVEDDYFVSYAVGAGRQVVVRRSVRRVLAPAAASRRAEVAVDRRRAYVASSAPQEGGQL